MFIHRSRKIQSAAGALVIMTMANYVSVRAEEPPLIPREVFFGNEDRGNVQISPDGTHLSFLAPADGTMNVWVQTVGADDAHAVTRSTTSPIHSYFWACN